MGGLFAAAVVLASAAVAGCGAAGTAQSFFMVNKNTQAILRDTITAGGTRSFLQNPQDSVHGVIRLAPVEALNLQEVALPANPNANPPFNSPHKLMLPAGFTVSVYASNLNRPRDLALREDGTLFYSDFDGKVMAITPDGAQHTLAQDLKSPHGLELHNGTLFFTDETRLFRYDFSSPTSVNGTTKLLTEKLPTGSMHYTRAIRWVANDKRFYLAIGSTGNKNIEDDNSHATLLRISETGGVPDAATRGGLRDVVAMDVHPETGDLWGVDNGTELLSPLLPATEINIMKTGKHYGWPFFYSQNFRDPDYEDATLAKYSRFPANPVPPVVELEGHAEALGMRFYEGTAFGADWKNAMIITLHESAKVVRVRAGNDGSNARQADFITGFEEFNADGKSSIWGRPVGVAISADGRTLYISDDRAGAIYKVTKL